MNTPLDVALFVVKAWLGRWYTWGGDDPSGVDCSGLMVAALKAAGVLPRGGDWNANTLMGMFPEAIPSVGCLVFWPSRDDPEVAGHVEMIVGLGRDSAWTIGASGGGRSVRTIDDAIERNAFVKVRPMRSGHIAIRNPFAP